MLKMFSFLSPVFSLLSLIPPPFNIIVGVVLIILLLLAIFLLRKWIMAIVGLIALLFIIKLVRKFMKKRKAKKIANDDGNMTVTTETTIRRMDIDRARGK